MLEWALRYIQLGWPVIPLRGKIPLTTGGSKDATLNEPQVRAWWSKWPDANIGVATGHAFFAVDIDLKEGGEDTWDMLRSQYAALPDTIQQITGTGGKHILFALPEDFVVKNSASKLGPGLDVRGQGGYIVVAPSIHPETGRAYDWDGMEEIEQTPIAKAPVWLLRLLREAELRKPTTTEKVNEKIAAGGRNDALFRIAARLRRLAFSSEEIFASLREINQRRCQPPLDEPELKLIAGSAARYAPDARADAFSQKASQPAPIQGETELPLTFTDVEAGILDLIAKNDLAGVFRAELIEQVAKLRVNEQALLKAHLKLHFKDSFLTRDFERAVKDFTPGRRNVVEMPVREDPPPTGLDVLPYPYTDSGNGERLVALFGQDIRYCIEMQKWLVWDGKRWGVDDAQEVTQKAKQMARLLYSQVAGSTAGEKHARQSESAASIAAALKRASTEPGIAISASSLDQNAYLLNCVNGVVDLKTGKLLPHDRELLITKLCHLIYEPKAECRQFLDFLHWAMGANADAELTNKTVRLISFLQRAFGYSLTGDVSEKVVFICWGKEGNNGKTTLLTLFRELLGEYSTQILIDSLMTQRGGSDSTLRADLADLRSARFVMTSEVEKEHKLSEGTLKRITAGQGKIKSRRLYENLIEFDGTHKLFMDCNHKPVVRGQDNAIWRRLLLIPFEVSIPDGEIDKQLPAKLLAEGQGILAWAVRGCILWMKEGLGVPQEMNAARQEWREHDDPLADFLEDCCDLPAADANHEERGRHWVPSAKLSSAYAWWCKREHEKWPLGRDAFLDRIHMKGFESSRGRRNSLGKQVRTIEGLKLKDEVDNALDVVENRFGGSSNE